MGYNVELTSSDVKVKKENLEVAYQAACELNKRDDLKTGGSYSGGKQQEVWFAWMDANYPETCKNLQEVLEQVGFYTEHKDGDLHITGYDSKTGAEEHFMRAISKWVEDGYMTWVGEDHYTFEWAFQDGEMSERDLAHPAY